jgi:L-asparaginase II
MTDALTVSGSVELAVLERSGMVESRHLGAAVLVGPGGEVITALGDPDALVYPRSTLKLLQATTVLATGVELDDEELVLVAASHAGTERHVAVVERLLADAGLGETALHCPFDWPSDEKARRAASAPRRITMTCSGKHAGFLAACRHVGWATDGYLDPEHPLQHAILSTVEEFTGETVEQTGVDGCGAPVHAVTLAGLARGTGRVVAGDGRLASAIRANAWALDGEGRVDTVTVEQTGLIAKLGAEGVLVLAAADGTTAAVKVLDGSARATSLIGLELFVRAGLIEREAADRVLDATLETVFGGGQPAGAIRVAF